MRLNWPANVTPNQNNQIILLSSQLDSIKRSRNATYSQVSRRRETQQPWSSSSWPLSSLAPSVKLHSILADNDYSMNQFEPWFFAGGRMVIPRLPLSQLLRGDVHLIDEDRIVGGTVVEPNSLPFQISLQRRSALGYSQSCGGSIYSESVILNAAHCVRG